MKDFTTVNSSGKEELKSAVGGIALGTYTAVEYGLSLARGLFEGRVKDTNTERNEVVIVFTDGASAHSGIGAYQEAVANDSVAEAKILKDLGVEIHGVSIENGADASDINKFMHYLSSNFPNATNMDNAGTGGSIDNGYYFTTDDSHSLSMVFDAIIHDIDHPTITLGQKATMIDALSPYFDFENGEATNSYDYEMKNHIYEKWTTLREVTDWTKYE